MSLESLEVMLKTHEKNEYAWGDKYEQMEYDLKIRDLKLEEKQKELDQALKERDGIFKVKLEKWSNASVLQNEVLNKQRYVSDKSCIGFGIESSNSMESDISSGDETLSDSTYENFKREKAYKAVPPPTGTIIPPRANIGLGFFDSDDEETDVSESQKETAFNSENSETSFENRSPNSQNSVGQESRTKGLGNKGGTLTKGDPFPSAGTARSRVPQAVLSRSTDGSYYPRMDNRRPRISSYSPSSRSSTTRTPHRPQRPKKVVKLIWVKKGSTVGSQAVLPQTVKKSAMISPEQTWKPKENYLDSVNRGNGSYTLKQFEYGNPEEDLKDYAIIDSGCSGSMTGDQGQRNFYVEELKFNLLSVSQICDKKHNVLFTDKECLILSPKFKFVDEDLVILRAPRKNDVYSLDLKNIIPSGGITCLVAKATEDEAVLWHRRLGHVNFKNINKLVKDNLVRGLPSKTFKLDHSCVACRKGKQHRASCKKIEERTVREPLELLHMDLFGPVSVESINKKKYCLVVTDDCSKFSWVFFLAYKDETYDMLHDLIVGLENRLRHKVKTIRCDHGTEFKNQLMNEFCAKKGIKREYSIARTPQQNGVAERKNRTLIEAARTMLADSLLPIQFWAEAVNTACYVLNRVLVTKPQMKTPYEILMGRSPNISFMRPFGCSLTILNTLDHLGKFDGKSEEGYLLGYSTNSKGFRVYNRVTRKVQDCLHVNFLENQENQKGKGPDWMFDLDLLTPSMNYIPVRKENYADSKEQGITCDDAEDLDDQQFIVHTTQPMPPEERTAAKEVKLSSEDQALHDELVSLMHQESLAKAHNDDQRIAFEEEKRRISIAKGKEHKKLHVTPDWKEKGIETEEVNIEENEASNVKSGETEGTGFGDNSKTARQDKSLSIPGPYKLNLNSHSRRRKQEVEELKKTKPKTTLRKPTSLAQERNQMMNFLKDFIPMEFQEKEGDLNEREAKRLLRKRKATIAEEQPSKKPKLRTETIDELRNYLRAFDTLWEIRHILDRHDLYTYIELVGDLLNEHIPPTDFRFDASRYLTLFGRRLNQVMMTSEGSRRMEIIRWRFHDLQSAYTRDRDGTMIHMLAERDILYQEKLMERN
ncbi:putative ribonuclease H-like domain-containing protein [Tanacetum coccineum]|uniref:Ribonuclease H-like domain-containing protein n=1 Tax=Tanacetum coccineum TaxID=301880 RepID=A0ABQ5J4H1_9ASTR